MKKTILIFFLVVGGIMWRYMATSSTKQVIQNLPEPTVAFPSPIPQIPEKTVEVDGETYAYFRSEAFTAKQLKLIGNYTEKLISEELMETNRCTFGVNGGFYDTSDRPLGWTVISGNEIAKERISKLFNGYISVTDNLVSMETSLPEQKVTSGLQTGPILVANGRIINLQLVTDKNARRMVMATDSLGNAVFFTFYTPAFVYSGPMLSALPKLVRAAAEKENLEIRQAINLDGGSASAFYSGGEFKLVESNPVGSWWCVK